MTIKNSVITVTVGIINVNERVHGEGINSVHGLLLKQTSSV